MFIIRIMLTAFRCGTGCDVGRPFTPDPLTDTLQLLVYPSNVHPIEPQCSQYLPRLEYRSLHFKRRVLRDVGVRGFHQPASVVGFCVLFWSMLLCAAVMYFAVRILKPLTLEGELPIS